MKLRGSGIGICATPRTEEGAFIAPTTTEDGAQGKQVVREAAVFGHPNSTALRPQIGAVPVAKDMDEGVDVKGWELCRRSRRKLGRGAVNTGPTSQCLQVV